MRISDWSSDVCSSDLALPVGPKLIHDFLEPNIRRLQGLVENVESRGAHRHVPSDNPSTLVHLPPSPLRGLLVGLVRRAPDLARLRPGLADAFHVLHAVADLEIVEVVVQQADRKSTR